MSVYNRSSRQLVEKSIIMDTKHIKRAGLSEYNASGFTCDGNIFLLVYEQTLDQLNLYQNYQGKQLDYVIHVFNQACNYGGVRHYFVCPKCGRNSQKLYLPPHREKFACRECHNLTYRKQKNHNKSNNKFRWNWVRMEADKLIEEGKTRTVKQRRKIQKLRDKSDKLIQKYGHEFLRIMDKFQKIPKDRNL